jgi:two-component system, NtrC family, response regulator HydG
LSWNSGMNETPMKERLLIVEDQFIEANDLRIMLTRKGYTISGIARSVQEALECMEKEKPDLVLLDIYLKGNLTGIDLAGRLREDNIPFIYLSANSSSDILAAAKTTEPYGFLVKPFRERDVLVALEIARYRHEHSLESKLRRESGLQKQVAEIADGGFEGMIGRSPRLLSVFESIAQVAPQDTSVLILGESGTGKERVAECIQKLSSRKNLPFVKVNCATLPATLIESELFGHEKGAFTGATDRRIGKFEQASGGTILLDEIGEMPIELQAKWLRVLQEKEIERIGGKAPIRIDARVIATTNRNLEQEVAQGRFRLDLYYRLNVFPVYLPPLRERVEDIPALVNHFIHHYAARSGKKITGVADKAMQALVAYSWPGNIRELEHLIERTVVLTQGDTVKDIPLPVPLHATHAVTDNVRIKTMVENERDHIIEALKACHGRIWGAGGAAELLGIPPTTLQSKMKKLGINKDTL